MPPGLVIRHMCEPRSVLSRYQAREIDQRAIREYGMTGLVLMENAGRGCAELLVRLGIDGPVVVCTGKGNNGGDGFVIARHLDNAGYSVRIASVVDTSILDADAAANHQIWVSGGGRLEVVPAAEWDTVLADADWVVDALLGTGIRGEVRSPYDEAIEAINRTGSRVLAVDLPSGLDCDTGQPLGRCVRASHTATMVASKLGMMAAEASEWIGEVHVVDIGIPRTLCEELLR